MAYVSRVGLGLCVAAVIAAPLAAGGVHRPFLLLMTSGAAVGLALFAGCLAAQGRVLRFGIPVVLPLVLLVIPILQSIPIPLRLRQTIDPNGTSLLRDNDINPPTAWPLSLDPPVTRARIGVAAAGLMAFLVAYHLASGRDRRRHSLTRALGAAGIAAVAIGLGHRILGLDKLYGLFNASHRALLMGPFVNSNHTAEFLELTGFVCLACSFQRPTALNRVGWMVGTVLCAGGAAATLSRGAAAALAMGVCLFTFLRYVGKDSESAGQKKSSLAWGALLLALAVVGAGSLGAGQLIDRFKESAVTADVRFQLWHESLRVLFSHPFGIGRGAFDRIFPVYRTLKTPLPLRFAFVENEPLQLLIDSGWLFFAFIVASIGVVIWQLARHGRRDQIEAALVAGLFALAVHSLVDFGLETSGVLLPTMAVLGLVLGRQQPESQEGRPPHRGGWAILGLTLFGLIVGAISIAHASNDDFDALIRRSRPGDERRAVLLRAQEAHPFDYFYALTYASLEPLKGAPGKPSPRMHSLNRALRLCPGCDVVHQEIARNLWRMGLRSQALLEWRTAVQLQPQLFMPVLGDLFAAGATPQELASISTFDPTRMVEVAAFLSRASRLTDAIAVLDQADALGAAHIDSLLMRGTLQLQGGQLPAALATVESAHAANIHDPRLAILEAKLLLATKGAAGADQALSILDSAAIQDDLNLPVQRARMDLIMTYERWQAAPRSLEGFKRALFHAQGSASEAHTFEARIESRRGHWTAALGEYRIALADDPTDVSLWIEFGQAAEKAGRDTTAREAYLQAGRLLPSNTEITAGLRRVDDRLKRSAATGAGLLE